MSSHKSTQHLARSALQPHTAPSQDCTSSIPNCGARGEGSHLKKPTHDEKRGIPRKILRNYPLFSSSPPKFFLDHRGSLCWSQSTPKTSPETSPKVQRQRHPPTRLSPSAIAYLRQTASLYNKSHIILLRIKCPRQSTSPTHQPLPLR